MLPIAIARASTGTLTKVSWSLSSTGTGVSGVTYSYSLVTATSSNLTSVTFSVPPGTGGTPVVQNQYSLPLYGTTLPSSTATLAGTTLTITISSTYIPSGTQLFFTVSGLTNAATATVGTSTVTTLNSATPVDTANSESVAIATTPLTNGYWTTSSSKAGQTGATYTYGFTASSTHAIDSITMDVPPGTSGTPSLASVSPNSITGTTLSLSGETLTLSFSSVSITSGTNVTIEVSGMTNPSNSGTFGTQVTSLFAGAVVGSTATSKIAFTSTSLTSLSWSASSTTTGASGVAYTFAFSVNTSVAITSVTLEVPPGTTGTPAVGSSSVSPSYRNFTATSVSLSGNQLTFSFASDYLAGGNVASIEITGLTNTPVSGSYVSSIGTYQTVSGNSIPVDSGIASEVTFTSTSLNSLSWAVSSTAVNATNVAYTFGFSVTGSPAATTVTMTVPPGTSGSPVVGTVTPPSVAVGTVTLVSQTLTYTFPLTTLTNGTAVSIEITGLKNTSTANSYASTLTLLDSGAAVASGASPSVSLTATVLSSLSWTATSTSTNAAGVSYTYGFTTSSATSISSFVMTVPSGTSGTPTLGTVSVYSTSQGTQTLASTHVTLSGTTLTLSFTSLYMASSTAVSIEFNGLTNTSSTGTYASAITTKNGSTSIDSGTTPNLTFSSTALGTPTWSPSSTGIGATNVTYSYSFTISATSTLTSVSMTVPTGTGGTPTVSSVTPSSVAGGAVTLTGTTLTYTFSSASVTGGNAVTLAFGGIANTSTAGSYVSTITASDVGTPIASGSTPSVNISSKILTALSWSVSSSTTDATGVSYTYGFTTSSATTLSDVTMTVPPGTSGTPAVGTVTASQSSQGTITLASQSVVLAGTTLTFSFTAQYIPSNAVVSIEITGLTNTSTYGSYTSNMTTKNGAANVDSGTSPSVSFYAQNVTATPPTSLTWATGLVGSQYWVADTHASDESFSVIDATGTNAGWHVSVSATTFTNGAHTLADSGTFSMTGSTASHSSTSQPTVTCETSCVTPTNSLSYPIAITTAPSSPLSVSVFSAALGTGSGSFVIGGSTAANPVGWWVRIPGNALAGTYTSTITFDVGTGP